VTTWRSWTKTIGTIITKRCHYRMAIHTEAMSIWLFKISRNNIIDII